MKPLEYFKVSEFEALRVELKLGHEYFAHKSGTARLF